MQATVFFFNLRYEKLGAPLFFSFLPSLASCNSVFKYTISWLAGANATMAEHI